MESVPTSDTEVALSSAGSTISMPGTLTSQVTGEMLFGDDPATSSPAGLPPQQGSTVSAMADDLFGGQLSGDTVTTSDTVIPSTTALSQSQNVLDDVIEVMNHQIYQIL